MEKFIHIHAKARCLEVFEQVSENKAVARLIKIRKNFQWYSQREGYHDDKLTVTTKLVNPQFQFTR